MDENQAQQAIPLYQCHKKVRALKIKAISFSEDGTALITPEDDGFAPFNTRPGWAGRWQGSDADRGYYVLYEDGYTSWSPSPAFEDGYTKIHA